MGVLVVRLKKLLVAGLTLSLFGLGACGESDTDKSDGPDSAEQSSAQGDEAQAPEGQQMPEPDLDGIPEVVAEVDGEEIGKDEFVAAYEGQFQQMAMQAQMSGEDLDQDALKQQTAEQLVNNELLVQEAAERGIEAPEAKVDDTLKELAQQNNMTPKKFLAALAEQGMSEDQVRGELETQVRLDGLIADEAGGLEPTEAEMRALYDNTVMSQKQAGGKSGKSLPSFQKLKPQLAEQVRTQKENQAGQALVTQLRESADITIHL